MKINVLLDFSSTPGARYMEDGPFSGEEFYCNILKKSFDEALLKGEKLEICLDGTEGYATSFLDEAFGKLATDFGSQRVWENIIIVSNDEPDWINEIKSYIFEKR